MLKHVLPLLLFLSIATFLFVGCQGSRMIDVEEARNAYEDAHLNLRAGVTTLSEVVAKYGPWQDRAVTSSGFACRWQERRTVVRRAGRYGGSSETAARTGGEYQYAVNYLSTMEVFFTDEEVLINYRLTSDLP